jgi:hypothetical protein
LYYGVVFDEGFEFPWDTWGEEDWWIEEIVGWKPPVELYDKDGNYINGFEPSKEDHEKYYASLRKAREENPFPVKLINYCSGDCPMWMIAVGQGYRASRGYPEKINPELLVVSTEEVEILQGFIEKYIGAYSAPGWYLTSYWG